VSQHPALTALLANDHQTELRHRAAARNAAALGRDPAAVNGVVRGTGWLLVELGLRLAVSRRRSSRQQTLTSD
jgi:hypothetical protein